MSKLSKKINKTNKNRISKTNRTRKAQRKNKINLRYKTSKLFRKIKVIPSVLKIRRKNRRIRRAVAEKLRCFEAISVSILEKIR